MKVDTAIALIGVSFFACIAVIVLAGAYVVTHTGPVCEEHQISMWPRSPFISSSDTIKDVHWAWSMHCRLNEDMKIKVFETERNKTIKYYEDWERTHNPDYTKGGKE